MVMLSDVPSQQYEELEHVVGLHTIINSCIVGNSVCNLVVKLVLHGSNSVICRNIDYICEKYNLGKWYLEQAFKNNCTYHSNESDDVAYVNYCRSETVLTIPNLYTNRHRNHTILDWLSR
jgi:hypothetical protein